jgi:excisionase family DNA binding protein
LRENIRRISEPLASAHAPLAVPPREAARLLSIGLTNLYGLVHAGELSTFRIGAARRLTVKSIEEYMQRQLAACDVATAPADGIEATANAAA